MLFGNINDSNPRVGQQKILVLQTIAAGILLMGIQGIGQAATVVVDSTAQGILKTACTLSGAVDVINLGRNDPNNNACVATGVYGNNDTITFSNALAGQTIIAAETIKNIITLTGPSIAVSDPSKRVTLSVDISKGTVPAILSITDASKYYSSNLDLPPFNATIRDINFVGGADSYNYGATSGIYYYGTPLGSSLLVERCDFTNHKSMVISASTDKRSGTNAPGSLTVRDANFIGNTGGSSPAGTVYLQSSSSTNANFEHVVFSGNRPTGSPIKYQANGTLNITDSVFYNNKSGTSIGGAVYATGGVTAQAINQVNIVRSSFINNQAINGGNTGNGGAIYASLMKVNVIDSIFEGNVGYSSFNTGWGGAIYVLTNSSVALVNPGDPLNILRSTFVNNSVGNAYYGSGQGGAIYVQDNASTGVNVNIAQSTFSGNSADGSGGAIATINTTIKSYHSTFVNNTASKGATLYVASPSQASPINSYLYNTLVTGNSASVHCLINPIGKLGSGAYNLVWRNGGADTSCGALITNPGDPTATLGALADNGGLTKTQALLAGSPAIAAGNVAYLKALDFSTGIPQWVDTNADQRSYLRPAGAPDLGAYAVGGVAQ